MNNADVGPAAMAETGIVVRPAVEADLQQIAELDERVTGLMKRVYWDDIYERFATRRTDERFFLVAQADGGEKPRLLGYIIGEVRAWEFGSEPCGWVFALAVDPDTRLQGVGERLFQEISAAFRTAGVKTMRTMVPRDNRLHMAFFRSEGMVAGPYIELEMELENQDEWPKST